MARTLAIVNGKVWQRAGASAVAVRDGRIKSVGHGDFGADEVLDAAGAWILPAFNDAHVHFLMGSRGLGQLDLSGVPTWVEIGRRITQYAREHAEGWILGRGWLYSAFPGGMPSVEFLDRLVPDRPAYLESFDAHTGWANRLALPPSGGVLREAARDAVIARIPAPTRGQDLAALRAGMRMAASRGIASVQEAGDGQNQLALWAALRDAGEQTMRIRLAFDLTPETDLDAYGEARGGILKAFLDGVVESRTAAMLERYHGSTETGEAIWRAEQLRSAVHEADARGWQVQIHAIGDAAIRMALDSFEGTTPGRRHRIEHIETPDPSDVPRFGRLGVVASMQPQHADPKLTETWRHNLGPERAARGWPWRALLDSGARVAFGTDWPVAPLDPLASVRMAAGDLGLDEAVNRWTSGSAYAEHQEKEKGEVREGMLADLAVVDLDRSMVQATVVDGRIVYES